jgi:hypothetical protein
MGFKPDPVEANQLNYKNVYAFAKITHENFMMGDMVLYAMRLKWEGVGQTLKPRRVHVYNADDIKIAAKGSLKVGNDVGGGGQKEGGGSKKRGADEEG